MNKKKLAIFAYTDYGNTMTYWCHAINGFSKKIEAKIICVVPHRFSYSVKHDIDLCFETEGSSGLQVDVQKREEAKQWLLDCDHLIFAEEMRLLENPLRYRSFALFREIMGFCISELRAFKPSLRTYIHHCGMDYRSAHQQFNLINEQYFDRILVGVDLYRFTPGSSRYMIPIASYQSRHSHQDVRNKINQKFEAKKLKIFHSPSSHLSKGTELIRRVVKKVLAEISVNELSIEYFDVNPPIPNEQIIQHKLESHVFIDQVHDIGAYGISSVEALAMGNIVFSAMHNISPKALELQCLGKDNASRFPILETTMNEEEFGYRLKNLILKPRKELKQMALDSFQFYLDLMSFEALAKRFEDYVLKWEGE